MNPMLDLTTTSQFRPLGLCRKSLTIDNQAIFKINFEIILHYSLSVCNSCECEESVQKLKIKCSVNGTVPKKANKFAAGYDLYSSNIDPIVVKAHSKALIPTGCAFAIPSGNYGRIAPRSGLAWKHFLSVGAGVIDSDYRGEMAVILINHSDEDFAVMPNSRIAQMIIEKVSSFYYFQVVNTEIEVVDELDTTERGCNGFGSTGVDSDKPLEIPNSQQILVS